MTTIFTAGRKNTRDSSFRRHVERVINPHPLEILKRGLDQGRMVVELELRAVPNMDDDTIFIRLGEIDPAVSPLKIRGGAAGSAKE
jgi:hypothetical protein